MPKVLVNVPRPSHVDLSTQGYRGPFAPLLMALEFVSQLNMWLLMQRNHPPLYQAGVRYQPEPLKQIGFDEHFKNIDELIHDGWGDCDDIAPARVAELRMHGIDAKPAIKWKFLDIVDAATLRAMGRRRPFKLCLIHCLVQWPDGTVEDPCKVLGMKGEYS